MRSLGKAEIPDMNRMLRRLDALEGKLRKALVCLAILVLVNIGISILLGVLATRLIFRATNMTNTLRGTAYGDLKKKSLLPFSLLFTNTLVDILEISRPVRVFRVTSPGVPPPEALLVFWSFGPAKGSSSEGFLATFTPTLDAEVICFDYPEISRELHRFIPFAIRVEHARKAESLRVIRSKDQMPSLFSGDVPKVLNPDAQLEARNGGMNRLLFPGSPLVRLNLMMTAQRAGILVSSKPTDEVLGKGRNT